MRRFAFLHIIGELMRKIKAAIAVCLVFALCIPLFGCSVLGNGKYNVVARLEKQELCVAFRQNDRAGDAVIAAMKELQAEGEVDALCRKWFGEERTRQFLSRYSTQ